MVLPFSIDKNYKVIRTYDLKKCNNIEVHAANSIISPSISYRVVTVSGLIYTFLST